MDIPPRKLLSDIGEVLPAAVKGDLLSLLIVDDHLHSPSVYSDAEVQQVWDAFGLATIEELEALINQRFEQLVNQIRAGEDVPFAPVLEALSRSSVHFINEYAKLVELDDLELVTWLGRPLVEIMLEYAGAFQGLLFDLASNNVGYVSLSGVPLDVFHNAGCEAYLRIQIENMVDGPSPKIAAGLLSDFDRGTWKEWFDDLKISRRLLEAFTQPFPGRAILPPIAPYNKPGLT